MGIKFSVTFSFVDSFLIAVALIESSPHRSCLHDFPAGFRDLDIISWHFPDGVTRKLRSLPNQGHSPETSLVKRQLIGSYSHQFRDQIFTKLHPCYPHLSIQAYPETAMSLVNSSQSAFIIYAAMADVQSISIDSP